MDPKDVADFAGLFLIFVGVIFILLQVIFPSHFRALDKTMRLPGGIALQTKMPGFAVAFLGFLLLLVANGLTFSKH